MYSGIATQVLEINPDFLDKKRRNTQIILCFKYCYQVLFISSFSLYFSYIKQFKIKYYLSKWGPLKIRGPPAAGGFAGAHATALALSNLRKISQSKTGWFRQVNQTSTVIARINKQLFSEPPRN